MDLENRPLRDVIRDYNLRADKRLGQHFLLDRNLLGHIVSLAGDLKGSTVLEVGPGPGGLTRALLSSEAACIIAIETDPRCIEALAELHALAAGRLQVIEADALKVDLGTLSNRPITIIANLPYNVGTSLLLRWLDQLDHIRSMTLMFQREVAERLIALPGNRTYGRLSVIVQWLCKAERLMNLPGKAFVPPPKVASSIIQLTPREKPLAEANKPILEKVVAAAFGQRRKMLRSSLKTLGCDPILLLNEAGISETARAEDIDVKGFCRLANAFSALLAEKSAS